MTFKVLKIYCGSTKHNYVDNYTDFQSIQSLLLSIANTTSYAKVLSVISLC